MLVEAGADVNAVDKYGITALHLAFQQGHVEVGRLLLLNGADVNAVDSFNSTALCDAAGSFTRSRGTRVDGVLLLLCFGAQIVEKAIRCDLVGLLRPINDKLTLLRNG